MCPSVSLLTSPRLVPSAPGAAAFISALWVAPSCPDSSYFLSLYAYIIKIKCTISEPRLETKNIVKGLNMMHYFLAKENLPRKTSDCRADGAPAMLGTALPAAARDMSKRLTVFRTGMCWHQKVCRNSSQELGLVCWEVLSSKQWRLLKRFRWEVGARYKVVLCSVANRLCQGQVL